MNRILLLFCSVFLSVSLLPAAEAKPVLTVAIFDFEAKDDEAKDLGQRIAGLITAELSSHPQLITVERAELDKALSEQELGLSGNVTAGSAAKVGNLTGAKVLVTGRAFKADKETILLAKIIGTETGRVYAETAKGGATASLSQLCSSMAGKIATNILANGTNLVSSALTPEEKFNALVQSVKPGKRPSVSVKIAERHFGGPVIDPAAQTELEKILQKTGFRVLDEKSPEAAEMQITGEAFSAFGLRKAGLISCRSRIEIKVHAREGGKLLLSDRQTSVAVDVAEQTSAKTALQNAAVELAPRILEVLTR